MPVSAMTWGESGAASLTVTAPLIAPAVVGVKVTLTLQLAATFNVAGQLLVCTKFPLAVIEETVIAVVPLFFKVIGFVALVVPTTWGGKVSANGVGVTTG